MARQFQAFRRHPAALQLRYEDAARDFNATFRPVFKQFFPRVSVIVGGAAGQRVSTAAKEAALKLTCLSGRDPLVSLPPSACEPAPCASHP